MIRPTSKEALKAQCLTLCRLDIDKAEKMYEFLIRDIKDIPDVEPATKTFMQNVGTQANSLIGWMRENKDVISEGVAFIKSLLPGKGTPPAAPLPPING